VPSVHAHAHDDETDSGGSDVSARERPIRFTDIDRVLDESAGVGAAGGPSAVRVWRDQLLLAFESLEYARTILSADVGILRHCLATEGPDKEALVDDLPEVVSSHPCHEGCSAHESGSATPAEVDPAEVNSSVFARSDALMTAHREMARTDLSSPEDVGRALRILDEQLSAVAARCAAVQSRLQQIRTVIVRQYKDGAIPTANWPG
jgi:hypothetical protein